MKLTKNNLTKKLGIKDEEIIRVVTEYKDKLPILTEEGEEFCVNARDLHSELKVGRDFSTWIKGRIVKYDFIKGTDFMIQNLIHQNGGIKNHGGDRKTIEYVITMEMAKQLAMVQNNEQGKVARRYFIAIEKVLKKVIEWERIRKPEKEKYREMCAELKKYFIRNFDKEPKFYDYCNEADTLNKICLGATSKKIEKYIEAQDKNIRDWLEAKYNLYLDEMQQLNIMYLKMNLDKERRYDLIKQGFKALYPNASFVVAEKQLN